MIILMAQNIGDTGTVLIAHAPHFFIHDIIYDKRQDGDRLDFAHKTFLFSSA